MLTPHAILLKRSNFTEIVYWTRTSYENLTEILRDAQKAGEVIYVVFYRNEDGTPSWTQLTEDELVDEYGLTFVSPRFNDHFSKL